MTSDPNLLYTDVEDSLRSTVRDLLASRCPADAVTAMYDGDRSVVQKILKDNEITWRNALDGTTRGPLATAWNVRGWPTIYVIDAEGVIRARNLRGEALEHKAEELMREVGGG